MQNVQIYKQCIHSFLQMQLCVRVLDKSCAYNICECRHICYERYVLLKFRMYDCVKHTGHSVSSMNETVEHFSKILTDIMCPYF